jgi:Phosphoribosyl-ATP pyrophosphohydrolase
VIEDVDEVELKRRIEQGREAQNEIERRGREAHRETDLSRVGKCFRRAFGDAFECALVLGFGDSGFLEALTFQHWAEFIQVETAGSFRFDGYVDHAEERWQEVDRVVFDEVVACSTGARDRSVFTSEARGVDMNRMQEQVREFHRRVVRQPTSPGEPKLRNATLRARLTIEEALETAAALVGRDAAIEMVRAVVAAKSSEYPEEPNLALALDGVCDSIFVNLGTAEDIGVDIEPFFDEVARTSS